jgi:DNA-binding transcriptional LysR family regulator
MPTRLEDIPWARRLKLRHLEVFLVLCELRSITAAARHLHMTQPAVSHWLADVEDVIGTPLFVRGRQLNTTAAGEVLRSHAERMLGDVQRSSEELAAVVSGLAGRVHVGSITSAAPALIPRAIGVLQQEFPNLHVHVLEGTFELLLERQRRRELDVIIGPLDLRAHKSGFRSELLIEDTVAVVTSPGHAFARRRKPTWEEAASLPWIMPPSGTLMRQQLESAFLEAGVPVPEPRVESASIITIQMLLRQGDYISVLAGSVAPIYAQLHLMDIVKLSPSVGFGPIGMLWDAQKEESPMLARFLQALRQVSGPIRRAVAGRA